MSQITGAITLETRRLVEEIAAGVVARLIENGVVDMLAARVAEQLTATAARTIAEQLPTVGQWSSPAEPAEERRHYPRFDSICLDHDGCEREYHGQLVEGDVCECCAAAIGAGGKVVRHDAAR